MNLGILAGNRDMLNFDSWLEERIKSIGPNFVRAISFYLILQVFKPIQDYLTRNKFTIKVT